MPYALEVVHTDGQIRRYALSDERTLLGRGGRSEIRLPWAMGLEDEHVLLMPQKEGCWFSVHTHARADVNYANQTLKKGVVAWGDSFSIGEVNLRTISGNASSRKAKSKNADTGENTGERKGVHPVILGAAVVIAGFFAWSELGSTASTGTLFSGALKAPALFQDPPPCPSSGAQAADAGRQHLEQALSRAERYAFAPRDGITAVDLFARAQKCLVAGGERSLSDMARSHGKSLRDRIEKDYALHRVNLDRALEEDRRGDALYETRALQSLFSEQENESNKAYIEWLTQTERQLALESETSR